MQTQAIYLKNKIGTYFRIENGETITTVATVYRQVTVRKDKKFSREPKIHIRAFRLNN